MKTIHTLAQNSAHTSPKRQRGCMGVFPHWRVGPVNIRNSGINLLSAALAVIVCLTAASASRAAKPDRLFRAGAVAIDITPQRYPVSMTGSFWDRKATSAHDTLYARALVLDDSQTRIAIVVCDSCLISREIYDAAKLLAEKKTGIPTSHMLTSATHTHSAPTAVPLASCLPDEQYVQYLTSQIAEAIVAANDRLVPAKVGWAVARQADEVFNRRWYLSSAMSQNPFGGSDDRVKMNPPRGSATLIQAAGPTDPDVAILSVRTADDRPLAVLANYSLHYVGNIPPGQLSADYFGEFARQIKKRLGGDDHFVGILSNGTSGDINNINFRQPRPAFKPFQQIGVVASKVAVTVDRACGQIEYHSWVPLAMAERQLQLAVRRPNEKELAYAKKTLSAVDPSRRETLAEIYAKETIIFSRHPGTVTIKLQALRVGELGLTANPCESFVQIGLDIKKQSPTVATMNIGLANGYSGYLPTPQQHKLGGYETWRSRWSFLEVDASRKITDTLTALLREVAP